jgi:hypothetical protein
MTDNIVLDAPSTVPVPVTLGRSDHLSFREARQAPCMTCSTSPCCTYLLLRDFQLDTVLDVDYAQYLLNFDGIYLGLAKDRKMDVYLYQPCGYLDVPTGLCTVHSTPLQPAVCVHYNGHCCGYRSRMTVEVDPERPILNRARMDWLAEHMVFDDERRVTGGPQWDDILAAFETLPLERTPLAAPEPDPMIEQWRSIALTAKSQRDEPSVHRYADAEVSDPCQSCSAWCCKKLVFNRGLPVNASQLEFLRYCLGFPGVEVGVAADGWAVIVSTRCRHLYGDRCSVFGSEERPLRCSYFDALSCSFRSHFGVPRPEEIVRVNRDQFGLVANSIVFDELGQVVAIPPVNVLRNLLEDAERGRAGVVRANMGE